MTQQVFTNVLLDHVLHLAHSNTPSAFATINSLLPNLLTLSHAYPLTTAPYYVEKLALMQKNFMRGVARGALDPAARTWPGPAELTLLRLVGMVWSTSDLSHPVAAGAMLLIGQYLAQSRVRSLGDVAAGLFLCTLAAQYEALSKRLVPEAINCLLNSLLILLPTSIAAKAAPGSFPTPDLGQDHVKALRMRTADDFEPRPVNLVASLAGAASDTQLKVDLVASSLALLQDFAEKYVSMEAFVELFKPTSVILDKVTLGKVPASIKVRLLLVCSGYSDCSRPCPSDPDRNPPSLARPDDQVLVVVAQALAAAAPQADPDRDLHSQVRRGVQPEPQVRPRHGARRGKQDPFAVQEGEEGCDPRAAEGQQVLGRRGAEDQGRQGRRVRQEGATGLAFMQARY